MDIILIDEELNYDDYLVYLRLSWPQISDGGFLIIDRINYFKSTEKSLRDFCKIINRDYRLIDSKYGLAVIQK
jgi:hypothetical protein